MTLKNPLELAGFFAAHAIWCVSDGETLIPMIARHDRDGKRIMERLVSEDHSQAVIEAKTKLDASTDTCIALLYDGYITLGEWRTDAIMIDVRAKDEVGHLRLLMAVPYRPAGKDHQFTIFKPKFIECSDTNPDWSALGTAFFSGVDEHEKGTAIWAEHMDQTK